MYTINPSDKEKQAFMQILYTFFLVDKHVEKIEEEFLNAIGKDIFSMSDIEQVNLNSAQLNTAIGQIQDGLMKYYLIAIIIEIAKISNQFGNPEVQSWITNLIHLCHFPDETTLKIKKLW